MFETIKRKMKSHNFIIPLVVYPFDVMVSIGQTDQELKKILKKHGVNTKSGLWKYGKNGVGRAVVFETNQTLIRLPRVPKTPKELGSLNHEIFHAVTFIMHRIGMKLIVCKSDEAYAYLIGYLTEQILIRIKK